MAAMEDELVYCTLAIIISVIIINPHKAPRLKLSAPRDRGPGTRRHVTCPYQAQAKLKERTSCQFK